MEGVAYRIWIGPMGPTDGGEEVFCVFFALKMDIQEAMRRRRRRDMQKNMGNRYM
jgi:hypothetical protein